MQEGEENRMITGVARVCQKEYYEDCKFVLKYMEVKELPALKSTSNKKKCF